MIVASAIGGPEGGFPRCAKCKTTMHVGAARCYICGTPAGPAAQAPASQPAAGPARPVAGGPALADFLGGLLAGVGIVLVPLALRLIAG